MSDFISPLFGVDSADVGPVTWAGLLFVAGVLMWVLTRRQ